tara:strand:+ start:311 stop:1468 length:1158 start_codon:yes stop_codon:yes gene_type:complete
MDPLSVVAIAGMIYAGKVLSEPPIKKENYASQSRPMFPNGSPFASSVGQQDISDAATAHMLSQDSNAQNINRGTITVPGQGPKHEVGSFADVTKTSGPNPFGMPVQDFSDRQNQGKNLNNVQPMEKRYVGPGLGIGAQIPAMGGYQQLFRVLPNNVGGYKLTTLPGRSGPAGAMVSQPTVQSTVQFNKPEKTAYLPQAYPPTRGRSSGQGGNNTGMAGRMNFERTKRQTNRSVTTMRDDGLQYGPASDLVSAPSIQDNPTRNKGDMNQQRINSVAAPGIANFEGGYEVAPTNIRPAVNRGKRDRGGNAGRMNVLAKNAGMVTAIKDSKSTEIKGVPGPTPQANQTYVQDKYYQLNPYKGMADPRTANLGLAKNVLRRNPLNHNFS